MGIIIGMKFAWDDVKFVKVFRKRGLNLGMAQMVFEDPNFRTVPDDREDYGEIRLRAYGKCFGVPVCVVFTERDGAIRVITMFRIRKQAGEML